jgi:hypothetical protein
MRYPKQISYMSNIQIYKSADNKIEIYVNLDNETVWLTQQQHELAI